MSMLRLGALSALALVTAAACAPSSAPGTSPRPLARTTDPRVGLRAGLFDAGEAISNLRLVSTTPPPAAFVGQTNTDLAFTGNYVFQGSYHGFQVWDISTPARPTLVTAFECPASQSDVSVYRNLLFVSGEGMEGRLDCGAQGVATASSTDRLRGIRIFDISDIRNPKYVGNVQTCRGSHTHSVLVDPKDAEHVYVYVSGSAPVRPDTEMPGCSAGLPSANPNSAMFRIEVIKVPLADPAKAAIVGSPRIFEGLVEPPRHGTSPADKAELDAARARGAFLVEVPEIGETMVLPDQFVAMQLAQVVRARGGEGNATAADSALLRERLPAMIRQMMGGGDDRGDGPRPGPNQCHDITLYPAIGLAGGACEGYGLLLDIKDPANPRRIAAVADSNFSYWHSATFNNDGTKVLFTDEWGGGGAPKCREGDPMEWGANAIFTIENGQMVFQSYYKLPAPQTAQENCVAHNGSLIPVPGRDIMVQSWYQGGISVFDWTDPRKPFEIAFHDRGPVDAQQMEMGGSWSVYWYNGLIVNSEIARGLDIFELVPGEHLSANEIEAAKSVRFDYLNPQGQLQYSFAPSFAVSRSYVDQLARSGGLSAARITAVRTALGSAEAATGAARAEALMALAAQLEGEASGSRDAAKVRTLSTSLRQLAGASR
jgi:hypothetical protein